MINRVLVWAAALLIVTGLPAADARPPSATVLSDGTYVLPPTAFTRFCLAHPAECEGEDAQIHIDPARLSVLEEVNREVNAAIAPIRGLPPYHDWSLDVREGDCNNYA